MTESKASENRVRAAARQAEAMRLRVQGLGFAAIAQQLGYSGPGAAYDAVTAGLSRTLREPADELRELELHRLDALQIAAWQAFERSCEPRETTTTERVQSVAGHADRARLQKVASAGDPRFLLVVFRCIDRRARLLGLDPPATLDVTLQLRREAEARGLDPDLAVAAAQRIIAGWSG